MRPLWRHVVALLVLLASTSATAASAQSRAELARSRALFEQGLAHAEALRWTEARGAFEQALAITERPSILLNLATAQAETGALLESAASYRRFLVIATTRDQRQHRAEAERALAAVEARLGHIELDTSGLAAGDTVLVDGAEASAGSIAVNPGAHRVLVRREGRDVIDQSVTVAEGRTHPLTLRAPSLRPTRTVAPIDVPIEASEEPASGGDDALAIGLGVGLGVGALVVGAIIVGVVVGTSSSPMTYQGNLGGGVIRF